MKNLNTIYNVEWATKKQVADYYKVKIQAISSLIFDNKDTLIKDGLIVLKGLDIVKSKVIRYKNFTKKRGNYTFILDNGEELTVGGKGITLFNNRTFLRTGMLLTESEVAAEIRQSLLHENATLYYELSKSNQLRFKKWETEVKNFLEFSFGPEKVNYQVVCGKYKIDFILFNKVIVEVDEFGHMGYCSEKEKEREDYIIKNTNYKLIRYNPNKEKPYCLIDRILQVIN